jgi:[ribosomal protein S5]-alanine N-acetyltransferase
VRLSTERLLLVPLTRRLMTRRLSENDFAESVPGLGTVHFGQQWPGDPLPAFPTWLAGLAGDDDPMAGTYVVVTRDGREAVGLVGTKGGPSEAGEQEIGYGMNPAEQGRGYATEAVGALVADLLAHPEVRAVTAFTAVGNRASQRVLEKLGFARTGIAWDAGDGDLIAWSTAPPAG